MSLRTKEPPCRQLREDIKSLSFPKDDNVHIDRRFFPESGLFNLITEQRVTEVLHCSCPTCSNRVEGNIEINVPQAAQRIVRGQLSQNHQRISSISLFALLVYIECPQLIRGFFDISYNDYTLKELVEPISTALLQHSIWPGYDNRDPTQSETLAEEFKWHKYKFTVPHIDDSAFTIYDQATILPFFNEQPLGRLGENNEVIQEGGFGIVHSFEILPQYNDLAKASKITKFARKQLQEIPQAQFKEELKNLELVKKLEDPHIIQIVKAYKHGNSLNLVFPCARTNLGQYLRDSRYGASTLSPEFLEDSPFWPQMLGITRALDRMSNYVPPKEQGGEHLYGYHLDLKPANILVEDTGTWVISDFGQAKFKPAVGTSRMTGVGGTEAYAPPEIDQRDVRPNRQYDVWSLGCILLEVCTFLVKGYDGLKELDSVRITKDIETQHSDDRFFRRAFSDSTRRYELKPQVQDWIRDLPNNNLIRNQRSEKLLRRLLGLVQRMLDVNLAQRLTSDLVYSLLSGILRESEPLRNAQNEPLALTALPPDEIELGKDIVPELKNFSCYLSGLWIDGPLRLVESSTHELRLLARHEGQNRRSVLGNRSRIRLIPEFALHGLPQDINYHQKSFSIVDEHTSSPPRRTRFYFRQWKDTITMQSVLLGQNIRRTIFLQHASFDRRLPLRASIQQAVNNSKAHVKCSRLGNAMAVQLWSERSYRDPNVRRYFQRKDSPRTARDYFFHGACPRRIVIFFQYGIVILRMAKNARAEKPVSRTANQSLRIVPTDKSRDSSFTLSLLMGDLEGDAPSIRLDRAKLDELEAKGAFECKCLQLEFKVVDDCKSFYKAYKILKDEWLSEERRLEECRKSMSMGEVLGWAPN